jgi:hypothetical protein
MQTRHLQPKIYMALLTGAALLCSANLSAAIYKTTNAEGKTVYTDTPDASAKASVEMSSNQLSVVSTPSSKSIASEQLMPEPESADTGAAKKAKSINYSAKITSPADGSTVFKAQQTLQIQASVNPAPALGARTQIKLDGKVVGSGSASVDLMPLPRGQHTVSVQVVSSSGQVLSEDSASFYLYQPSRLF